MRVLIAVLGGMVVALAAVVVIVWALARAPQELDLDLGPKTYAPLRAAGVVEPLSSSAPGSA